MRPKSEATAFVEWVNSFECVSKRCRNIIELSDGIVLSQILAEIDPKRFKVARIPVVGGDRLTLLKNLHKSIADYYEQVLDRKDLNPVNLEAISKGTDVPETVKLCQLVICIAAKSKKSQMYLGKIQTLSRSTQYSLQSSIDEGLKVKEKTPIDANTESPVQPDPPSSPSPSIATTAPITPPLRTQIAKKRTSTAEENDSRPLKSREHPALARLIEEFETLQNQHKKLLEDHTELRYTCDELQNQKKELETEKEEIASERNKLKDQLDNLSVRLGELHSLLP